MTTTPMTLEEIHDLAHGCLSANGTDSRNADAISRNMTNAERDGSHSHGLFRLPAHIASLRSGKIRGDADPKVSRITESLLKLDGDGGFAPLAQEIGIPVLAEAARAQGVAVLAMQRVHHMAALWPEVEALADQGLVGLACTPYMPAVAPAGATKPLFGTNPIAFAWPRPGQAPAVFDMATASMAMGEVQIAAREGYHVPAGTGLDRNGKPTTDPAAIADGGVLLPFGGYKGSAIAMMVELLAAGLVGENFSFEAKEGDNGDGGPPRGGEFILALDPARIAGAGWAEHCEVFFSRYTDLEGVRLPGARRHHNRQDSGPRAINTALVEKIRSLM